MTSQRQPLPAVLERVLDGHTLSVGTVELLMLLYDGWQRRLRLDEICRGLGCPPSWAETQLDTLQLGGLAEGSAENGYAYAPTSRDRASAVETLARAWHDDRVGVSRRIFASTRSSPRKGRSGGR